ncbi:MAG: hypothetical protein IJ057_11365 [Bacteroidales bacterium]|nr:hypothetical protein [Bacteroidales bacterium]
MSAAEQAMNYDLAIDIINLMKMMASDEKDKTKDEAKRKALDEKIDMYCYEESVLNGKGDDSALLSLYDKVFNLYSPIIKEAYANR